MLNIKYYQDDIHMKMRNDLDLQYSRLEGIDTISVIYMIETIASNDC